MKFAAFEFCPIEFAIDKFTAVKVNKLDILMIKDAFFKGYILYPRNPQIWSIRSKQNPLKRH
ncbi:hypothetical protein D3C71_1311490 [compost metagenome]